MKGPCAGTFSNTAFVGFAQIRRGGGEFGKVTDVADSAKNALSNALHQQVGLFAFFPELAG